LAMTGIAAA
jgi:quercetin dioxygenase-like cupin family protein